MQDQSFLSQMANDGLIKALILHDLRRDSEARVLFEQELKAVDAQADSKDFGIQKGRHDVHAAYAEFLIATGDIDRAAAIATS